MITQLNKVMFICTHNKVKNITFSSSLFCVNSRSSLIEDMIEDKENMPQSVMRLLEHSIDGVC